MELYKYLDWDTMDTLFDHLDNSVIIVDRDGIILYTNACYERLFDIDRKNFRKTYWGKNVYDLNSSQELQQVVESGLPLLNRSILIDKLGIESITNIIPIKDGDEVVGAIFTGSLPQIKNLINALFDLHRSTNLESMHFRPKETLPAPFQKILGNNTFLVKKLLKAAAAAMTDSTVLIEGESGTGKELLAQAIHESSHRSAQPFVVVNCAAIPEALLESELFGYEPGAFTGASHKGKPGKFEAARGGAVFLDEVAELPMFTQAKLLRAIQFKQIEKVGGVEPFTVDVRIIAATNKKLSEQVKKGLFREDLFYRLNVIPIEMMPLRERKKEDLFILCEHFLLEFSQKYHTDEMNLSPEVILIFYEYNWPGNVRELKNAIEHAFVLAYAEKSRRILPRYLPATIGRACDIQPLSRPEPEKRMLKNIMEQLEGMIIRQTLAECKQNKEQAIKRLGISRAKFYSKMKGNKINGS